MTKNIKVELTEEALKALLNFASGEVIKPQMVVISEWERLPPEIESLPGVTFRRSMFLKPGQALRVDAPQMTWKRSPLEFDRCDLDHMGNATFAARMTAQITHRTREYFSVGWRPYRWQRKDFESLRQWGERLFFWGMLDDPAIRWEYQKAVWTAPLRWLHRRLGR